MKSEPYTGRVLLCQTWAKQQTGMYGGWSKIVGEMLEYDDDDDIGVLGRTD